MKEYANFPYVYNVFSDAFVDREVWIFQFLISPYLSLIHFVFLDGFTDTYDFVQLVCEKMSLIFYLWLSQAIFHE